MLSGVPNFAFTIGYTNASWTLKADLVAEYVCRLLSHLDAHGLRSAVPVPDPSSASGRSWTSRRATCCAPSTPLPKQGDVEPWKLKQNYFHDMRTIRRGRHRRRGAGLPLRRVGRCPGTSDTSVAGAAAPSDVPPEVRRGGRPPVGRRQRPRRECGFGVTGRHHVHTQWVAPSPLAPRRPTPWSPRRRTSPGTSDTPVAGVAAPSDVPVEVRQGGSPYVGRRAGRVRRRSAASPRVWRRCHRATRCPHSASTGAAASGRSDVDLGRPHGAGSSRPAGAP